MTSWPIEEMPRLEARRNSRTPRGASGATARFSLTEPFEAVADFRRDFPGRPLILALTGTDLYGDIHTDRNARQALEMASRLVVLQAQGRLAEQRQLTRRGDPRAHRRARSSRSARAFTQASTVGLRVGL